MMWSTFLALLGVIAVNLFRCDGKTAEEWKGRIIYQILTDRFAPSGEVPSQKCTGLQNYCGGTFRGIEKHLDYITGLGANAIWISPIVVNTPNGYHGYWAQNIFEINPHFGTKEDLKSLVTACHDRDVWVMVDVVANHMGYAPSTDPVPDVPVSLVPRDFSLAGDGVDVPVSFNKFVPFNDSKYFHPRHPYINWPEECKDQWKIELYWLANLPDLNQSHPFVHQTLLKWIQDLTTEFMFDGVRLDTAIQVPKPFWAEFRKAGGVFMMGEANNGPPPCGSMEYVGQYQEYIDSVLAYSMYWTLRWIFQEKSKDFTSLSRAVSTSYEIYKDRSVFGGFVDNHDNPRFLSMNPNQIALKNELTFVIMGDWIPIIYYGTEQGFNGGNDPNNRESLWPFMSTENPLYKFIEKLTEFRKALGNEWLQEKQVDRHVEADVYAFSRGKILVVITTKNTTVKIEITNSPYEPGNTLTNVLNPTEKFKVSSDGSLPVILNLGQPLVLENRGGTK